jgi:hypothetical protein
MTDTITYIFRLASGVEHRFEVDLNRPTASGNLPDWTLLDTNKCANCPLASAPGARCPAAADLVPVVAQFSALASIESVDVRVVRSQYEAHKHTDTQTALSALMGLILATSACPILSRMRPLAQTHLPFPTETEVVYRIAAMHLLGCYLEGTTPDLSKLTELFEELEKLNEAFARRLKRAIQNDAGINALVVLHARNMVASFSVEEKLDEIRAWYKPGAVGHA